VNLFVSFKLASLILDRDSDENVLPNKITGESVIESWTAVIEAWSMFHTFIFNAELTGTLA
jgi:hypothetical protein